MTQLFHLCLQLEEMKELLSLGGDRVHPVLWVTPQMIQTSTINNMLNSGIKWQMLKMHWKAHPEWYNNKLLSKQAIELAQHLKIPILLHTGLFEECRAGIFEDICIENNKTVFVLAHGCPLNETINIMQKCNNVYVDTAFMQAKDVNELIQKGFLCRILYGSDTPINEVYFPKLSTKNYLLNEMRDLEKIIGHKNYQVICQRKVVGRL